MEPVGEQAASFVASPIGRGLLTDPTLWFRLVDFGGHFLFVSPQVQRFLGYASDELADIPGFELVHPDEQAQAREAALRIRQGPISSIYRMRHREGHYIWVNTHAMIHDGMVLAIGRPVPERLQGFAWKFVEPFV